MATNTDAWIKQLTQRVSELLGNTEEKVRAKLYTSQYMPSLTKVAQAHGIDLRDRARRSFVAREVRRRIEKLIRTQKWQEEQKKKQPFTPLVTMNKGGKRYIEYTLPPGDRE